MDEHLTTSPSADVETLNETSIQTTEASTSTQTPETIPYARFKEVNDKFRTTEQELNSIRSELDTQSRLNQELNAALMLLQQQGAFQQQPASNVPQVDPFEYWQTAEQDPLTWEQTLSQKIMGNIVDHFSKQQKVETTVKTAVDQTLQKYPDLNNDKGKYFLENYARFLDEQLPPHIPVAQVFEMAASEINQFISGFKSQGIQESQSRTAEKLQAFTEGSGNLVPPDDLYQSALSKAKKTGNVEDLIRVKVQRMNTTGI